MSSVHESSYNPTEEYEHMVRQAVKGLAHKITVLSAEAKRVPDATAEKAKLVDDIQKATQAKAMLESQTTTATPSKRPHNYEKLVEQHFNLNQLIDMNPSQQVKETLVAIRDGLDYRLKVLKETSALKATVDKSTSYELSTQLQIAVSKGNKIVVKYIYEKHPGIDVTSAKEVARRKGFTDIYKFLDRKVDERIFADLIGVTLADLSRHEKKAEIQEKYAKTEEEKVNIQATRKNIQVVRQAVSELAEHAVKQTNDKKQESLGDMLLQNIFVMKQKLSSLHPKDAMHLLLDVVRPPIFGRLIFFNVMLEQKAATSAHEVAQVKLDYNDDTSFRHMHQQLKSAFPESTVVLLERDANNLWHPIDLSEEEDVKVWHVDQFAVAHFDAEGKGTLHIIPKV